MADRTCPRCSSPVERGAMAVYCGRRCKRAAEKKRAADRKREGRDRTHRPIERACAECEATFTAQRPTALYCGSTCRTRAHTRRTRAANPEREAERRRRKAARTAALRDNAHIACLVRDPCSYCGGPGGTIDHIEARHTGGTDDDDNLTGACQDCNGRKGTTPLLRFLLVQRIDEHLRPLQEERASVL